jgi:hypothetical protein
MKITRVLLAAFAVAIAVASPLSAAEDPAIESFKKDVAALESYTTEQENLAKRDPMAGITMIRGVVAKVQSVKTDGLPADLKEGWKSFAGVMAKMGEVFKGWPEKPEDVQAFILKKGTEDPAYMGNFEKKMTAIESELEPVMEKLEDLSKKYGLDGIGTILPGGK